MKLKGVALAVGLCFLGVGIAYAQHPNPFLGTWTLNATKSKIPAGKGQITKVTRETAGQNITITSYGTAPNGNHFQEVWTGKFNGRYYPLVVAGNSVAMVEYTRVGSRTLTYRAKQGARILAHGRDVLSADGKTSIATNTYYGTGPAGKPVRVSFVFDKQ
jgi:hypothetical protein